MIHLLHINIVELQTSKHIYKGFEVGALKGGVGRGRNREVCNRRCPVNRGDGQHRHPRRERRDVEIGAGRGPRRGCRKVRGGRSRQTTSTEGRQD